MLCRSRLASEVPAGLMIQRYILHQYDFEVYLVTQWVENLSSMQDIWVRFLGREDPVEEEMATYSSILAQKIPWTEEPGRP